MKKLHPIKDSCLFRVTTKKKLSDIFDLPLPKLNSLKEPGVQYRERAKQVKEKVRIIHLPLQDRMKAHRKLFYILSQINPPDYLHSGIKNRSFKTNAEAHQQCKQLYKLDLKDFYPRTKLRDVSHLFVKQFECPKDVADYLAKICCFKNQVPVGSPVSQAVAFFSHKLLFDDLSRMAFSENLTFTCYVDDLTFSGKHIPSGFAHKVQRRIEKAGLIWHKERLFLESDPKEVTGVIITAKNELKPTNKNFRNISSVLLELHAASSISEYESKLNRLNGLLGYRNYVDPSGKQITIPKAPKPLKLEAARGS